MMGRSRLLHSGSTQGAAGIVVSLALLAAASVGGASVFTKSYSCVSGPSGRDSS
ncbi:MAG TPA: hypothetical protein VMH22_02130 [bacterium]|nr:hypothetical protein [bacterium]